MKQKQFRTKGKQRDVEEKEQIEEKVLKNREDKRRRKQRDEEEKEKEQIRKRY